MKLNGVIITNETILATRQHFINIAETCIADAISGKDRVNDLDDYIEWRKSHIEKLKNGKSDYTLTFLQAAYWIQTGICIPILA